MEVTTTHKFIAEYPAKQHYTKAIVGTIHPHLLDNFAIDFFYGNVGSLWNILGQAFPCHDFKTKESIVNILDQYGVWITDVITQCDRPHEREVSDSKLYNLKLNKDFISQTLKTTNIDTLLFTSRFSTNNATKLFVKMFDIDYKSTFNEIKNEFTIPANYFGRPIKCIVLYSPSGQANIGISKSKAYDKERYKQFQFPITQFKIDFYRKKFSFLNENLLLRISN